MIQKGVVYAHQVPRHLVFIVTHVDNWSQTNSTISIRILYRMCDVVYPCYYDSATANDSSAASCRISSQISPMSLIALSSLFVDDVSILPSYSSGSTSHSSHHHLPFTMLLDSCVIILFPFSRFNRIDLQMNGLSHAVKYNLHSKRIISFAYQL